MTAEGVLKTSEEARQACWQGHFCKVFNGKIVNRKQLKSVVSHQLVEDTLIRASPSNVEKSIAALGRNKGVGKDLLPAELLDRRPHSGDLQA